MQQRVARSPNKGHATPILFSQRDIILQTNLCDIDESLIFSCAKNIPIMLERKCPTLSQTSNMKLSYKGILHFHNTDDCITRILRHDVTFCMWHFGIGL